MSMARLLLVEREKVGMIDLTVKVPGTAFPSSTPCSGAGFQRGGQGRGPAEASAPPTREWTNSAEDIPLARTVWEKLSPHAKTLLSLLMDLPGRKISGEDLAKELGIPNGKYGIAGVWRGPGGAAPQWAEVCPGAGTRALRRERPLLDDQEIAELFKKVRAEQRLAQNRR